MSTALTEFLNAGLLPIGEDDEKFNLLEASSTELANKIATSPSLTYRAALVGFDSSVKADDPTMRLAEVEIRNKWPTSVNKLGPSPVQVYRAVILRALELAAEQGDQIKGAIALIIKNAPPLHNQERERALMQGLKTRFELAFEEVLLDKWAKPIELQESKLTVKARKIPVTKESLSAAISAAAGPTDKAGKAIPNANPHLASDPPKWAPEFATRAGEAIFSAIQQSSKVLVDDIQDAARQFTEVLVKGFNDAAIRDAKSELLWLRMSMYSPSGKRSYRSMEPDDVLYHVIVDVSSMVGASSPPSVEFFIRELVSSVTQDEVELRNALLGFVTRVKANQEIFSLIQDDAESRGRRSWLHVGLHPCVDASFEDDAGVKSSYSATRSDFAVSFYREIQIRKLLSKQS